MAALSTIIFPRGGFTSHQVPLIVRAHSDDAMLQGVADRV